MKRPAKQAGSYKSQIYKNESSQVYELISRPYLVHVLLQALQTKTFP